MKKLTNYKKIFLGLMFMTALVAGGMTVNSETASADCTITSTLRVGSVGLQVQCLQGILGVTADGKFGPITRAAVVAWQRAHGLVADGIVGPITRAALMAQGAVSGNFPPGCTSASGFSVTTGQPCYAIPSILPAGCTTTAGYSPLTGVKCDSTVSTLPPGCLPGYAFSVTTGQRCVPGTTTPTPSPSAPLQGGAGSATITQTSVDVETEVAEGKSEKVLAFRVEAEDSDIQVNNVKVTVENTDNSSNRRPDRYLDTIEIWMGNTKVGSVDASDLSQDSGNVYSRTISLSNAIVREGESSRQTFYVVFNAEDNIDSTDMTNADFDVDVTSVRFTDAAGAIMTSSTSIGVDGVTFTDLASSGEVRIRASLGDNNPDEGSVQVNEFTSTSNVKLLEFELKAESTDMTVEELSVDLTSTISNLNTILSDVKLMHGTTTIADYSGSFDADNSQRINFNFYDDVEIDEGDTETFSVVARLLKQDTNFTSGATLTASLSTPLSTYLIAEDENGDSIENFSGSAAGFTQTLFVDGASIAYVSSTSTQVDQAGQVRDFVLVFDVTAIGDDLTVDRTVLNSNNSTGIEYSVSGAGTNSSSASLSSNASLSGNTYTVFEGQTRRFTLTVTVTTDTTGQKKIVLEEVGGVATSTTIESVSATVIQ